MAGNDGFANRFREKRAKMAVKNGFANHLPKKGLEMAAKAAFAKGNLENPPQNA